MKVRHLKQRVAQVLIAATLVTSTGFTSLAAVLNEGELYGKRGSDYRLVTLEVDEGSQFDSPLEYRTVSGTGSGSTATGSDATPSTATSSDNVSGRLVSIAAGKKTTFAVGGDEDVENQTDLVDSLEYGVFEEALAEAGLKHLYEDTAARDVSYIWTTEKGNLDTEIKWEDTSFIPLDSSETILYGITVVTTTIAALDGGSVSAIGLPAGAVLQVRTANSGESKPQNDINEALEKAEYAGLDLESVSNVVQLDINIGEAELGNEGAVIRVDLPDALKEEKENGKEIVVIHFHEGNDAEVLETEDVDEEGGTIQFTVRNFSIFALAAVEEKVTGNAKVTLKKADNGFGVVYSGGREGTMKFLPIGEEVEVPVETKLRLGGDPYYNYRNGVSYRLTKYVITVNGTEQEVSGYELFTVPAGNVVLQPVFERRENGQGRDEYWIEIDNGQQADWSGSKVFEGTLQLYKGDSAQPLNAENWALVEDSYLDNEVFEITDPKKGTIVSKEPISAGDYMIEVSCEYNGETVVDIEGDPVLITEVQLGVCVPFLFYQGTFSDNTESYYDIHLSNFYEKGTEFDRILSIEKNRESDGWRLPDVEMYGGYVFKGWYRTPGRENTRLDNTGYKVEKSTHAYAGFYRESDKNWYGVDSKSNTGGGSGGSGGSGGGGGSSRGSSSGDTMTGGWQRDERGWRFQVASGSYAANTWGKINGSWYYFGSDTYMMTGWVYVGENWYYLNPSSGDNEGKMQVGWIYDAFYQRWFYTNASGAMLTGWQQLGSSWYYLNPVSDGTRGAMFANQWIDGYYVNENGAWVETAAR